MRNSNDAFSNGIRKAGGMFGGKGGWLRITLLVSAVLFLVIGVASANALFEQVDADQIVVIQSLRGKMTAYTTPGPKLQLFGKVTSYQKRGTYDFNNDIRFNDGGAGKVRGSIQYIMPLDHTRILALHEQFSSQEAVEVELVKKTTDKSIYMTGPLLSSTESYASRRTDLIRWINDQIENGIYQTETATIRQMNPLTGDSTTITIANIRTDTLGTELRQEQAYLTSFGITTANFAVDGIDYDGRVQAQIDQQQENIMAVQTSASKARTAEQDRITTEQEGLASAAKARAEQEVIKAREVTAAESRLAVARLDQQAAEAEKQANILRGQGEAERKRLVMNADGALDQKLATYERVQAKWAEAIASYGGAWVPTILNGTATEGGATNGAISLMETLSTKAAMDLALDLSNRGGNNR